MKKLAISLAIFAVLGGTALFLLKGAFTAQAAPQDQASSAAAAPSSDVATMMQDHVLGKDTAPVTIIEFASLTCPHCAHFEKEVLPEVKKSLLDTGKAKLIMHEFPLDDIALKAAMMTRCLPADKYYDMIEVVFNNQSLWMKNKDPLAGLAQLGSLAGMNAEAFKACTQNHALETALLNGMQDAQKKYSISSTPTFVFNNGAEVISGVQPVAKFEEIVNKLTQGK